MRITVTILGKRLLELTTESDPPATSGKPGLEATSGGQFEMGFTTPPAGEVTCRCSPETPRPSAGRRL